MVGEIVSQREFEVYLSARFDTTRRMLKPMRWFRRFAPMREPPLSDQVPCGDASWPVSHTLGTETGVSRTGVKSLTKRWSNPEQRDNIARMMRCRNEWLDMLCDAMHPRNMKLVDRQLLRAADEQL